MGKLKVRNCEELMENKEFLNFLKETGCELTILGIPDGYDTLRLPDGTKINIDIEQSVISYMADCVEGYESWKRNQRGKDENNKPR